MRDIGTKLKPHHPIELSRQHFQTKLNCTSVTAESSVVPLEWQERLCSVVQLYSCRVRILKRFIGGVQQIVNRRLVLYCSDLEMLKSKERSPLLIVSGDNSAGEIAGNRSYTQPDVENCEANDQHAETEQHARERVFDEKNG